MNILKSYDIFLITFKKLNLDLYQTVFNEYAIKLNIIFFEKEYFADLKGYNALMLQSYFYKCFAKYSYMLIYQLDCFIFRDELNKWCEKNYDYIGAPWFTGNSSHEEGAELWKVGNGGFSLRKVETFIKILEYKKNIYTTKRAYKITKANYGSLFDFIKMTFLGKNNRIKDLLESWNDAEDIFYCLVLENTKLKLNIPNIKEAMQFAFEKSPAYLFKLNNQTLPFGCHAWKKYQYETFWINYIC
ncbi:MAG: DUF5672 family protein [Paludibacteraceae bacterium]